MEKAGTQCAQAMAKLYNIKEYNNKTKTDLG